MVAKLENENGIIEISGDIIAKITGMAVNKCQGVVGMASRNTADGLAGFLKREAGGKGVRVESEDDMITIDIHIIVEYGISIPEICDDVAKSVRLAVEEITGLRISKINVCVDGIRVEE